jgi:hypothetical protein
MKKKNLPEFIFVTLEVPKDSTDPYLLAHEEAKDALAEGEPAIVGTYKLVELNELSTQVVSKPCSKRK